MLTWEDGLEIPELLLSLGEDLNREGLIGTPDRVQRAWREFLNGYTLKAEDLLATKFTAEGWGFQMCKNVTFSSMCEHHLLPFAGTVQIGYTPKKQVVGLSKLVRLVDCFAQRLQIQERMTQQIADALWEHLEPKNVVVSVEAKHMCACSRGVKRPSMSFVTCAEYGKVSPHMYALLGDR